MDSDRIALFCKTGHNCIKKTNYLQTVLIWTPEDGFEVSDRAVSFDDFNSGNRALYSTKSAIDLKHAFIIPFRAPQI